MKNILKILAFAIVFTTTLNVNAQKQKPIIQTIC